MNSLRFVRVLVVAISLGLVGRADAQDEASPDAAAAICKTPQCPGIVGAWQRDIKACEAKTARIKEIEEAVSELMGKLAGCSSKAADTPTTDDLAKAAETANAWKAEADRFKAEKEKLQERADAEIAALRKEVERLSEENGKLRPTAESKKQPATSDGKKKQAVGEGARKQKVAMQDKTQPSVIEDKTQSPAPERRKETEAPATPPGQASECVALAGSSDSMCLVKTPAPGWLMARSRDKADQGSALFLRPLIDPGVIPKLPRAAGNAECRPLRDVLKALEPLDPRPSVDAVFARSGDVVAQCFDAGDGDWKLRPVAKDDRKLEGWILIPETQPDGAVRP